METGSVSKAHVLIVEGDPDFASSLQLLLMQDGYSTSVAHDGVDALDAVRKRIPELITLDVKLAKRSGLFFYRQLKTDDLLKDIPVIVISGLSCRDPEMEAFIYTFLYEVDNLPAPQAFFEKPVEKYSFLRVVDEILRPAPFTGKRGVENSSLER